VVVGVVLVFNPFASLAVLVLAVIVGMVVTGISELSSADQAPSSASSRRSPDARPP
jgi:uncharacterized membrane protein HdeD (DUF308 family)